MHWKPNNEMHLLVLVLAPKDLWIILYVLDKVLCFVFWAEQAIVSCQAISPSSHRHLGFGFCLVLVFHWERVILIVTVTSSSFAVNQSRCSCYSPLWRLVLLWSEFEPHLDFCFIHICNFRLCVYPFLLVFFDSLAGKAFLARSIELCLVDNKRSSHVIVAGLWIASD